jgi:PAS domain S-box-containing protein
MKTNPPSAPSVPDLPALGLLEGLSRLHQTVLLLDESDRVAWVSGELGGSAGSESCVMGRSVSELFQVQGEHIGIRAQLDRGESFANRRIEVPLASGTTLQVEFSAFTVTSPSDGQRFCVVVVRPADESAPAEPEPVPGVGYLMAMLDSSPEAVLSVDRRGFVTYANPAFERLFDRRADELRDKPVALAFSRTTELEALAEALGPDSENGSAEFDLQDAGTVRRIAVSASPLRLPDGSHVGTVAFLRDVSQARTAERALARKNAELEHYVNAVSHDLRTPLVSLLGFSRLLADDYGDVLTETGRHFLDRIEQASRSMEALINDLLELSRIGQANGRRELVDPLAVLKQLGHEFKPRLEAGSIRLVLPEAPSQISCVRTQLYQVFSNLIGNAIDHMGEPAEPRIEVDVRQQGDACVLHVRDNGAGIPPAEQGRVFEIFHTLGHRGGERRGTGIGLAIVKKVAESHGGRAWLESEPGQGAAFFVSFPRS